MEIIIDNVDFINLPAEKYWSFPSSQQSRAVFESKQMIFSNQYAGARKMDGDYFRFIKGINGEIYFQSRTESVKGGYTDKYEWVPQLHPFFQNLPNGVCIIGELYFPNNEGSRHVTSVMGCLKDKALARQSKEENKLHYYIFDVWAWKGKSCLKMNAEDRFNLLSGISNTHAYNRFPYIEFAKYYIGPALWEELSRVRSIGGEGIVITKLKSTPEPGKRTARKTLKIKKELDNPIDCFLTGKYKVATMDYKGDHIEDWKYWYDTRTGDKKFGCFWMDYNEGKTVIPVTKAWYSGWASAIEIGLYNNGEVISLGWISGISDDVKEGIVINNSEWKYRVVKINAMELDSSEMTLRHGKIIEWRADGDKNWTDCTIDQIK